MNTVRTTTRPSIEVLLGLIAMVAMTQAHGVALAPELAGRYAAGAGVDGTFLKVKDDWQQSTVLWNEVTQTYGSGVPVSSFAWGSGLWGIADWRTANQAPTAGMIEQTWTGRVRTISFGDAVYNDRYGSTWGTVAMAPLFSSGQPSASQDNWTSRFDGYIRISEAGRYNFSVLHDDGFFFRLGGAGAQSLELSNDYLNPRDSLGFATDLQLEAGLYSFSLGAYDRLQAGVVELSWNRDGGAWSKVPRPNLVAPGDISLVPEPATWALMCGGLFAVAGRLARRRSHVADRAG